MRWIQKIMDIFRLKKKRPISGRLNSRLAPLKVTSGSTPTIPAVLPSLNAVLNKTLNSLSSSSTSHISFLTRVASLGKTLGSLTSSSSGTLTPSTPRLGSLSKSLGGLILTSAARLNRIATLSKTLGSLTSTSLGTITSPSSVTYDTSIGNGVDAAGFADLPLKFGANRFFVNDSIGNDSRTSLQAQNPATPLATWGKAKSYCIDGAGDQIMVAQGGVYTDAIDYSFNTGGYSRLYPTVTQSYDPADALNDSKYGRASGSTRPVFTSQFVWVGSDLKQFIAIRGIDFNPGNISAQGNTCLELGDGLLFENCLFRYTQLTLTVNSQPNLARDWVVRNCAFYGQYWTDSYAQGLYLSGVWGFTLEDSVFYHSGWKIGATRDDVHDGGNVFAHCFYQQHTSKGIVRRNVFMDGAADGGSTRDDCIVHHNLYLRCPIGFGLGGGNSYHKASPFGNSLDGSFNVFLEPNDINTATHRGIGMSTANGKPFSTIRYSVFAHQATVGTNGNGVIVGGFDPNPSYIKIDHCVFWDAIKIPDSGNLITSTSSPGTLDHITKTNNIWDDATSGSNTNKGSVTLPNSSLNVTTLATSGGYADYPTMVQDLIDHPEAHKSRTLLATAQSAYGITLTPPLIDVAIETAFRTGNKDSGMIVGTQDGVVLSFGGAWPIGFTTSSVKRMWFLDGTQSAGSGTGTITQTRSDGSSKTTNIPWVVSTAPQLSALSIHSPTTTTATIRVTTTSATGKLYWSIDTVPMAAKVLPGEVRFGGDFNYHNYAFSGSQTVSSSGLQTINVSSLTGGTFYCTVMQIDGDGVTGVWSATTDGAHTLLPVSVTAGAG